jgi:heme/copper-type cytochrome/quinol oxidase subunit 4
MEENDKVVRKSKRTTSNKSTSNKMKKKMTGFGFYIVLLLTIIEDVFDLIANITVVLSFLVVIVNFIITAVVFIYMYKEGVKPESKKIALWGISFMIESFPFTSLFPSYSISLILTKLIENNKDKTKKLERVPLR